MPSSRITAAASTAAPHVVVAAKVGAPKRTGDPSGPPVSPSRAVEARIPPHHPVRLPGPSASPTAPTAASSTIFAEPRPTTAYLLIHPFVPDKSKLSPFDPPNRSLWKTWRQTACKPGSVPPACRRAAMAIPLGRPSPGASCDRPERRRGGSLGTFGISPAMPAAPTWSCSRWGFPCRRRCRRRGALLPHHFTLAARPACRRGFGGVFSVALSLGSPPPGVTRHRTSVEPGLSSPRTRRRAAIQPSGNLQIWLLAGQLSKRGALP
jgi:hypothetical protein